MAFETYTGNVAHVGHEEISLAIESDIDRKVMENDHVDFDDYRTGDYEVYFDGNVIYKDDETTPAYHEKYLPVVAQLVKGYMERHKAYRNVEIDPECNVTVEFDDEVTGIPWDSELGFALENLTGSGMLEPVHVEDLA